MTDLSLPDQVAVVGGGGREQDAPSGTGSCLRSNPSVSSLSACDPSRGEQFVKWLLFEAEQCWKESATHADNKGVASIRSRAFLAGASSAFNEAADAAERHFRRSAPAQGMEARSAETEGLGLEDDSPVNEVDAPSPSPNPTLPEEIEAAIETFWQEAYAFGMDTGYFEDAQKARSTLTTTILSRLTAAETERDKRLAERETWKEWAGHCAVAADDYAAKFRAALARVERLEQALREVVDGNSIPWPAETRALRMEEAARAALASTTPAEGS